MQMRRVSTSSFPSSCIPWLQVVLVTPRTSINFARHGTTQICFRCLPVRRSLGMRGHFPTVLPLHQYLGLLHEVLACEEEQSQGQAPGSLFLAGDPYVCHNTSMNVSASTPEIYSVFTLKPDVFTA